MLRNWWENKKNAVKQTYEQVGLAIEQIILIWKLRKGTKELIKTMEGFNNELVFKNAEQCEREGTGTREGKARPITGTDGTSRTDKSCQGQTETDK